MSSPEATFVDTKQPVHSAIPSDDLEQLQLGDMRRRLRRRRAHHFAFIALAVLVGGFIYFARPHEHVRKFCSSKRPHLASDVAGPHPPPPPHGPDHHFPGADPDAVVVINCPPWESTEEKKAQSFHFELPIDADGTVFLVSRQNHDPHGPHHRHGNLPYGSVKLVVAESDLDKIQVDVKGLQVDDTIADNVHVCEVEAKGDHKHSGKAVGVGLFTDEAFPWHYAAEFAVTVTFPTSSSLVNFVKGSTHIHNFYSRMPLFSHDLGDLTGKVSFDTIAIDTVVNSIVAEGISANTIFIKNAGGGIEGNFSAEGHLVLETANAPIKANVSLKDGNDDEHSRLKVHTANGAIDVNITLSSYDTKSSPGVFDVDVETAHAPVDVTFASAPVDSTLNFRAHTAAASAQVKLHKTYEGDFKLGTALGKIVVNERNDVDDPAGRKRIRRVNYQQKSRWSAAGSIFWDDGSNVVHEAGRVDVGTAMGDIVLNL